MKAYLCLTNQPFNTDNYHEVEIDLAPHVGDAIHFEGYGEVVSIEHDVRAHKDHRTIINVKKLTEEEYYKQYHNQTVAA